MNYAFWQAIANTPWWVYTLFIYLMYVGYLATKPQVQHIRQFYIMLPIVIGVSILGMFTLLTVTRQNFACYAVAIPVGAIVGWLMCFRLKAKAVEGRKLVYFQGTWTISTVVFTVFCVRYYFGHQGMMDPTIFKSAPYSLATMIFYGLVTGVLIGRLIFMRRIMKTGPYIPFSELELTLLEH